MDERKYCVATCHLGTDFGIFLSGPDNERLTMEEAKKVNDKGKFMFNCTADQYWEMEREALDTGLLRCIDDAMWAENKSPHKRFKAWDDAMWAYLKP